MNLPNPIRAVASLFKSAKTEPPILNEHDVAKWQELDFPKEVISSHPECVKFLLKSGLAFNIAMCRNSTAQGEFEHGIRLDVDKQPLIKVDGNWICWEQFEKMIEYDLSQESLIAKGQPSIGYNYISPNGLVQKHFANYEQIYAVEKLSAGELTHLQEHAKKFWETNEEIDPQESKDCVLQVVTTKRDLFPRNCLTENFLDNCPEHVYVRLVDNEGNVYSLGFKMPTSEAKQVFNSPLHLMTSGTVKVTTPDYEETRKFDERRVTSIPLTSKKKELLLDFVNSVNAQNTRFNYAKQNCDKFVQVALHLAGVEVDTRMTFSEFASRLLPSASKLPVIGPVAKVAKRVSNVIGSFFKKIANITPSTIKRVFRAIDAGFSTICRKIDTLFFNGLMLVMGGYRQTAPLKPYQTHEDKMDDKRLTAFEHLFNSPRDFFDDEKTHGYHSIKMVEWQRRQQSTHIHTFDKPRMYMLPPAA